MAIAPPPPRVEPVDIEEEIRTSFLDYAMSVIVARALHPQVGDGRRRRHRPIPPTRGPGDLRRPGPDGSAVLAALPARRRTGELRLHRRRSTSRLSVHRSTALAPGHGDPP